MGRSRKKDFCIFIILLVITIIVMFYAIFLVAASFSDGEEIVLAYNEKFNFDYKVWLKENDFYDSEYVTDDYDVIASSIDEIEISFDYLLNTSNYVKGESYYTINSRIVAYQRDDATKKKIWDYDKLIKDKAITIYDVDTVNVMAKDTFKINYDEYKQFMDDYKKAYAVSLVGNLIIEIEIKSDLVYDEFSEDINLDTRKMTLTIPLTESVVKITKSLPKDNSETLIEKGDFTINYLKLSLSLFTIIGGLGLCVFLATILVKLLGYDSKYTRRLNKILKTYNSIIVSIDKVGFSNNKKVINVLAFEELLDAQSELRVPILYCNVKPNKEAVFYLKYNEDTLVYKLVSDLYSDDKKKKNKSDGYEEAI